METGTNAKLLFYIITSPFPFDSQVGLVKASVNFERLSLHSLKSYLKDAGIEINVEIELDPYMTADEIIATGRLKALRNRARGPLLRCRCQSLISS
jgi:hypothetical protein